MSGEGSSSQAINHFPGEYDFSINPGLKDDDSQLNKKNVEFTFSTKLNCLFVKRETVCPFGILTRADPPSNSKIKVHVFSKDSKPVMRCRAHTDDNKDLVSPWHLMRCVNDSATYHCCEKSSELSIFLPFMKPESVAENVENFVFLCSTKNCIKKELFIQFSLMNSDEILGYQVFGLHVCSTPGRDRSNHESEEVRKKRKRKMSTDTASSSKDSLPPSQETFCMLAKKEWIYDYLVRINRGLELLEAVPHDVQERYLKRHRTKEAASNNTASSCTSPSSSNTRYTLRRILVKS